MTSHYRFPICVSENYGSICNVKGRFRGESVEQTNTQKKTQRQLFRPCIATAQRRRLQFGSNVGEVPQSDGAKNQLNPCRRLAATCNKANVRPSNESNRRLSPPN